MEVEIAKINVSIAALCRSEGPRVKVAPDSYPRDQSSLDDMRRFENTGGIIFDGSREGADNRLRRLRALH
jgi:hypothetical protein